VVEMNEKEVLKKWLSEQTYDKNYQDIECIEFNGYSQSYKTWEQIKDLIDWENKKVADLGCFHCYFSLKVAKEGAKVTSMDINDEVLKTSKKINEIENNILTIKKWEGGEEVSEDFDVTLCLNVLHHFKDVSLGLKNIKSKIVIFEVNKPMIVNIEKEFNIIEKIQSYRSGRIILKCEKIN
jgi:2-polyprenyl-3-methyl-5-hydroxy-6-metoxy-1,4-benzoquinol methylase